MYKDKNNKKHKNEIFKDFIINEKKRRKKAVILFPRIEESESCGALPIKNENIVHEIKDSVSNSGDKISGNKTADFVRLVCVLVSGISVLLALFVFLYTILFLSDTPNYSSDDHIETVINAVNDKVIFIKEHDASSGILTAVELYETRKHSVVTVVGRESLTGEQIGSGFVFSSDGYIATANHVVSGMDEINVITHDGKSYRATLVCGDDKSDVALLKIDAVGLTPVVFGSSKDVCVGERIYAIGTPSSIEYAGTLATGEVTYSQRLLSIYSSDGELEKKICTIQTNADLYYGNSGGPVFDEYGNVIGMVSMRAGDTSLVFALPSDGIDVILRAMRYGDEIDTEVISGVVTMPSKLGLYGESVSIDGTLGWKVTEISQCGSTAPSFIRNGDVIIRINSTPVCTDDDIKNMICNFAPGESVTVSLIRSGQELQFSVVLGS